MANSSERRPVITSIDSAAELRRWYWLKTELAAEAKRLGVRSTGAKFTVLERLCHFHDTGEKVWPGDKVVKNSGAGCTKFDWHSAALDEHTVITDNYKNTQNVRRYFQRQVDEKFKFNIGLLDWFKQNVGKTLGDAAEFWQQQQANPEQTKIKSHNQFNQYARDFVQHNPALGMQGARKYWALKRSLPSPNGRHIYEHSDLQLDSED